MWCVRCGYAMYDGSISFSYKIFSTRDYAFDYAHSRRVALNSHWTVEVLKIAPTSVECVV